MGNNKFYFNSHTLQYEKAEKTLRQKIFRGLAIVVASVFTFSLLFLLVSRLIDTPEERDLKDKIDQMTLVMTDMGQEFDAMSLVLDNLHERDANIHKVMFGMEPVDNAMWNGGTGGAEKYTQFEQFDYNGEQLKAIKQKADKLKSQLALQSMSLDTLESLAVTRENKLNSIPSIKPVRVDKLKRKIELLSGFGFRIHPIDKVRKMHYGIDFTAPTGTPIHATGKGTIVRVRESKSGFGHHVKIDHGFGYVTLYAHMSTIDVEVGQEVQKGEVIGAVGNTGRSTAAHCHYEVHLNGSPVNPIYFCHDGLTPEEYEELVQKASVANHSFD